MGYAIIFSGQGMQHPDMVPWLTTDGVMREACQRLGVANWRDRLTHPEWAAGNRQAQLLLTGSGVATWEQLSHALPWPDAVAGYSVGELPAFFAAGVIDATTTLDLAECRSAAMDHCAAAMPGGLVGVTGLVGPQIQALVDRLGLAVAIDNGPDSVVLGGPNNALAGVDSAVTALGGRCTRLKVSVASHTPWMRDAGTAFAMALKPLAMQRPRTVLVCNASAERIRDVAHAKEALAAQIDRTVRWRESMEALYARGIQCVLEVGPGNSLARLWNQKFPDVPARSVDEFRHAAAIARWVLAHAG